MKQDLITINTNDYMLQAMVHNNALQSSLDINCIISTHTILEDLYQSTTSDWFFEVDVLGSKCSIMNLYISNKIHQKVNLRLSDKRKPVAVPCGCSQEVINNLLEDIDTFISVEFIREKKYLNAERRDYYQRKTKAGRWEE